MNTEYVRIVVVGDVGVGKTSLVLNLVQDFQSQGVPSKAPTISLQGLVQNTRTQIIDTSSKSGDRKDVDREIRNADFICVLYDINVKKTRDNVEALWIPRIKKIREGLLTSLAVIGTKYDLCDDDDQDEQLNEFQQFCDDLIDKYEEIEFILESSAKENRASIEGVFERAQEAVLYPLSPLITDGNISQSFENAIRRIFKMLDQASDQPDNLLDCDDLAELRKVSFGKDRKDGADDVLRTAFKKIEEGEANFNMEKYSGLTKEGLVTLDGFIVLFKLMIEDDAICAWTILRKYGYDRSLSIRDDYCLPKVSFQKNQKLGLSSTAFEILHNIFESHCSEDKFLDKEALVKIFSSIPAFADFGSTTSGEWKEITEPWNYIGFPYCCNAEWDGEKYKINETNFTAMWMLAMSIDYKVVLKQFAYLGFGLENGYVLTKYVTLSSYSLVHVSIFGGINSGKSSLIRTQQELTQNSILKQELQDSQFVNIKNKEDIVLTNEKRNYGIFFHSTNDKWLVLEELTQADQEDYLSSKKDLVFDGALFMYDSTSLESSQHTIELLTRFLKLNVEKPSALVGTKTDLVKSLPPVEKKKIENCIGSLGIKPRSFSTKTTVGELKKFFATIIYEAVRGYVPPISWNKVILVTGAVTVTLAAFAFGASWVYGKVKPQNQSFLQPLLLEAGTKTKVG